MQNEDAVQVARKISEKLNDIEREALIAWLRGLLAIRNSARSMRVKIKEAIALTREAHIVRPIVVIISKEGKRIGWDERSWATRFALSGMLIGAVVFGGQGAGIAALGTAIGVPLWIVCGAGAAFAGVLLDELVRARNKGDRPSK